MRILFRSALCLVPLALAACAGPQAVSRVPAAQPGVRGEVIRNDAEYVARVEAEARRRGLTVQWLNPPPRREPARARR
ncbi:hypothetical protein [Luteimonas huabeiensis]|uniref:hypothetical protein n=1 Tax=Luteimonas huabeiensis TaxID=1244513 RepID=UPI0004B81524|nr:hypothetical protein [Luteimonas huabeiensis]